MAKEETTVIQGDFIDGEYKIDPASGDYYDFLFFVREKTTDCHINVRYEGDDKKCKDYYKKFWDNVIEKKMEIRHLQLTIRGHLEEDKMEYEGTGLIKLLS